MTTQPRRPAGSRAGGKPTGGRFAVKTRPDITDSVGFATTIVDPDEPYDWHKICVFNSSGAQTVFTRTVADDGTVTVETDTDDPTLLLLARKGDADYWSGETWWTDSGTCRVWAADITARMIEEGLVATGYDDDDMALREVMDAASSGAPSADPTAPRWAVNRRWVITVIIAQIRGLKLLQSMRPNRALSTRFGGYRIPVDVPLLLYARFDDLISLYRTLPDPPWNNAVFNAEDGYATDSHGDKVFVGEQGDLVWRALTEQDNDGQSPLRYSVAHGRVLDTQRDIVAAAMLHDKQAEHQLTTGLFDNWHESATKREDLQREVLDCLNSALDDLVFSPRWSPEQHNKLRGFV